MTRLFITFLIAILASCSAFSPRAARFNPRSNVMMMSQNNNKVGVKLATGLATLLSGFTLSISTPVIAANYGGFGSSYSEVLNPKDAVLNDETKSSDEVKAGVKGLADLQAVIVSVKADIMKNPQTDINDRLKKDLDVGSIRSTLNKYNTAFSEDTQRGTDRLIRGVIQDMTELGRDAVVKEGKLRSEVKVNNIVRRLSAAEKSLSDLAAFYPK